MIHYKIQITNSKNCNGKHIEIEECDTDLDGDDTNGFTQFDLTQNETVILSR